MPRVQLDLRGTGPDEEPPAEQLAGVAGAESIVVSGPVPALAGVLTRLVKAGRSREEPVAWEPAADDDSRGLARDLGIGSGEARELPLVRDDHGGVLLHYGRIEPWSEELGHALRRRFGVQAYNDAVKVADGVITRLAARPDWTAVDRMRVYVTTVPLRPVRRSTGRALQVACDPARVIRDGVPYPRQVTRWTWYADDLVRWTLQP